MLKKRGAEHLKIAICDDHKRDLLQIASLLEAYRHDRKAELSYVSFQNATELLASMNGRDYDLLLLDMLMPGVSGMQAAWEIRERNSRTGIVFPTFSPEYAVESYSVRAHYYLLKPTAEEKLFPVLDRPMADFKRPEDALHIKTQSSVFCLPYGKIKMKDGIPQSPFESHGYGMSSIVAIANEHNGQAIFNAEGGVFNLKIMLPLEEQPYKASHRKRTAFNRNNARRRSNYKIGNVSFDRKPGKILIRMS